MITTLRTTQTVTRGDSIEIGPVTITAADAAFDWSGASASGTVRDRFGGTLEATVTTTLEIAGPALTVRGRIPPAASAALAIAEHVADLQVTIGSDVLTPLVTTLDVRPDVTT